MRNDFLIRNAELQPGAQLCDVRVRDGRIVEIGRGLAGEQAIDACGCALIPGLADHHVHVFALAARYASVDVEGVTDGAAFAQSVRAAAAQCADGAWVRVIGYHERIAGPLSRNELDVISPRYKLRVQHQSGVLWMLNSLALTEIGGAPFPECVEVDDVGAPTGRIWRGDEWLRTRIGVEAPDLAKVGARLAALGVTALTDASVTTTESAAKLLADAHRQGALPQRLRLMSGAELTAPEDSAFQVGEVKLLLDEARLPDVDEVAVKIAFARANGRAVAAHCVSASELAFALAVFEAFDAPVGSRIEHGSVIRESALAQMRARGVTVVTQPSLIHRRGDRYLDETPAREHADLYRCASLRAARIPFAFSSDAPYGDPDPWIAIAAATERKTASRRAFVPGEAISGATALEAYLTPLDAPGGPVRQVAMGSVADLCLLKTPMTEALRRPSGELVAATLIGGAMVFRG